MATYDLTSVSMPTTLEMGDILNCPYTGNKVSITLPAGRYCLECWGAQGGYRSSTEYGGKGGYSKGILTLEEATDVFLYAGGKGRINSSASSNVKSGGFNGGGYRYGYWGGGGASDIRIGTDSLYARVIVAGGGGSDGGAVKEGGAGGGISGQTTPATNYGTGGLGGQSTYSGSSTSTTATTQATSGLNTSNTLLTYGGFGFGGAGLYVNSGYGGAGGGGWYGGQGTLPDASGGDDEKGGGGGSGFAYTRDTVSSVPIGYLLSGKYYLTQAETKQGTTSFVSPNNTTETGHSGDGYVRITVGEVINDPRKRKLARIQQKGNSSTEWDPNAILLSREIGIETDTNKMKIGDGITPWSLLPYFNSSTSASDEEIKRIKYYGDPDIIPSDESYFIVNTTGETITGLTDTGKTQTELVIPYEINGKEITTLCSEVVEASILSGNSVITKVVIPNSVTSIGYVAFEGCDSLTSVNIPNSVTFIDSTAFWYCTSLTSINIPNSVISIGSSTFYKCTSLTSVNIPNSVTSIGEEAFYGCTSLTSINIPNSVTTIDSTAFNGCTNLTIYCEQGSYAYTYAKNNNIPVVYTDVSDIATETELERLKYYGDKDIVPGDEGYFTVNETGETITGLTDTGKTQTELVIPYKINGIKITKLFSGVNSGQPRSILDGSTTITKIIIPKSVTILGRGAFYNCTSLTSINIPNGIISIDFYAFNGCSSLTSINIPNSVTFIDYGAFSSCSSLTSINISNSITSIGDYVFSSCSSLTSVNIPNSVTRIGDQAFSRCTSLTSINIPNSVTRIDNAFTSCANLKIYCEQGSYAETYANTNSIPIVYTDISATDFDNKADKATTLAGYGITDAYTKGEIDSKISNVYEIKGSSTIANLPTNPDIGDVYNITDSGIISGTEIVINAGDNVVYTSDGWDKLAATVDLSSYATETELERLKYYGDKDVIPYGGSYFTVNETGETITGLTAIGKLQTELVIPYEINGKKITTLFSGSDGSSGPPVSILDGSNVITKVVIPKSVTTLGGAAFFSRSSLTSINIPNSVTSIGDYAFYQCTSLTSINIPNSVTFIGNQAFWHCPSLTSINIPNSVTSIGQSAFNSCPNLKIYCEQGSYAETYANTDNIPVMYTDVKGDIATETELERIKYYGDKDIVPSDESYFTVTSTGETITGLTDTGKTQTELVIPYEINGKKITNLDSRYSNKSILDGNSVITKVVIPNSVTYIGNSAFYGCSSLTSINISNSVTSIGNSAFYGCSSLESINIPDSVTSIENFVFEGCTSLTSINIPNSVTSIGDYAFNGCDSLTSINIPNSVTSIGDRAFFGCTSLTSITIPSSVTSIGNYAFHQPPLVVTSDTPIPIMGLKIYCEQGSYAETYAKANNIHVVYTEINSFVSGKITTITVPVDGWTTTTDTNGVTYYTINITDSTLTSTGYPISDVVLPSDIAAARLQSEAYQSINKITVNDGSVDLYCFDSLPTVSFQIRIQILYM